jgi:hypothetical protein
VLGGIDNALFLKSFAGFAVMFLLMFLLRWGFSRGKSVAERPISTGYDDSYGKLKVAARPKNHIEGEMMRQKLLANGIKANLTQTKSGPRVLVFEEELSAAFAILRS